MKKNLLFVLCALGVVGCDSTKTYDLTGHVLCNFSNNTISCSENTINIPDNVVTDMYTENSSRYVHSYDKGIIICELDLKNATDVCRDEKGNLINGILKNYDKESGILHQQNTYENGKSIKSVNYRADGTIFSESTVDGVLRAYNKVGQLIYTTEISGDTIVVTEYDKDGNITNTEVLSK
jgi:hypothetical protein